jgi:tetratricopeptide (TPR) repeat protein
MAEASSRRRGRVLLLAGAALVVGALATSIALPSGGTALITVSRFGGPVSLAPPGVTWTPLLMARRLHVAREGANAVIDASMKASLAGGAALPLRVRIAVSGSGALPLSAGDVRRLGWDGAWSAWLERMLPIDPSAAQGALEASPSWRAIFPEASRAPAEARAALAPAFAPLHVASVGITAEPDGALARAAARDVLRRMTSSRGRLVVIGLDALDWHLVDDLVRRGVMPNLGRLVKAGAPAVEEMAPPLLSPLIWTSIATGVSPDVHGVLDFVERDPATGEVRPIMSTARKVPAIWEMAAAAGRTTAVIGWWATFPAQAPPGGSVYSDRLTEQLMGLEDNLPGLADPSDAATVAKRLVVRGSQVTPAMIAPVAQVSAAELAAVPRSGAAWDDPIGGLARLMAATITAQRLTDYELGRGTQDIFAYLEGTDTVGHLFGMYRPPPLPNADAARAKRFAEVVDRYHAFVDAWLGRVAAALGPDDTLVILSDHGFTWGSDRPAVSSGAHTRTAVYWHRPHGFFLAVGRGVRRSGARESLGMLDITPSLLALAGLPQGSEMPGHVPSWLLADALPVSGAKVDWSVLLPYQAPARVELPPEARAEELAKLKALGYLGGEKAAETATGEAPVPAAPAPGRDTLEARRLNNLGITRAESGDRRGAEEAFHASIEADPAYAPSHYALALLLREEGRYDESDALLWRAVDLGLGDPTSALARVAGDYRRRGEPGRAAAVLAEACRRFPDSGPLWARAGALAGERGELAEARADLERATSLIPNDVVAWRNLASAQMALGDREAARRSLEHVVRLSPGDIESRRRLSELEQ